MTKILRFILILSVLWLPASGHASTIQKHEVRAVWIATIGGIDWPQKHTTAAQQRELTAILDQLQRAGVNTVLLQTRVRASTIYPSDIEPFDQCITGRFGQSPGYDPLQFAVSECHRRGMECHAWIVTIPIGKTSEARFKEFKRRNPALTKTIGQEGYMNPENPKTGDYLANICAEVTRRYDIDGIHLDYIRYPETWPKKGAKPHERRLYITSIVRKIHQAVKTLKPWVKLSCSPIGKSGDLSRYRSGGWNARDAVYQDAQVWLRDGLMDQLYPMMYFRGNNFYPFALDWQERSYGRTIVAGLGIYFLSPQEGKWTLGDITREMYFLRDNSIGHCYFRSKFLTDNTRGIYAFARRFDETPALIPPMTWQWNEAPSSPTLFSVRRSTAADQLSWSGANDRSGAPYLLYNIYAALTPDVDTSEPRNLIATRLTATQLTVPHTTGRTVYYAVCALDRYGNESAPVYSDAPGSRASGSRASSASGGFAARPLTPLDTHIPPGYYFWNKKERKKYDNTTH